MHIHIRFLTLPPFVVMFLQFLCFVHKLEKYHHKFHKWTEFSNRVIPFRLFFIPHPHNTALPILPLYPTSPNLPCSFPLCILISHPRVLTSLYASRLPLLWTAKDHVIIGVHLLFIELFLLFSLPSTFLPLAVNFTPPHPFVSFSPLANVTFCTCLPI